MNIPAALRHRILTSLVAIPLILIVIFATSHAIYAVIAAIISLFAAWEWTKLIDLQERKYKIVYLILLGSLFLISYLFYLWKKQPTYQISLFIVASLWWLVALYIIYRYNAGKALTIFNNFFYGILGLFLIYAFWLGVVVIRTLSPKGAYWVLLLLLLIWLADSCAYFCGITYGRRKLAAKVSPGKTIEGLWGELSITTLVIIIAADFIAPEVTQFLILVAFGILSVIASVIGDLFISVLKRQRGLKDTGQLLPGHGGILDRIDSLLAATPLFALGLILFRMSLNIL